MRGTHRALLRFAFLLLDQPTNHHHHHHHDHRPNTTQHDVQYTVDASAAVEDSLDRVEFRTMLQDLGCEWTRSNLVAANIVSLDAPYVEGKDRGACVWGGGICAICA